MARSVMFRTSLAGYNKQDVNEYLSARAEETEALISRKNQQISVLSSQLAAVKEEKTSIEKSIHGQVQEQAKELSLHLEGAKQIAEELLQALSSADEELKKNAEYAAKAAKYDALASTLSQLLSVDPKAESFSQTETPDRSSLCESLRQELSALHTGLEALLEQK